jgi:hypothetical protein
MRKHLGLGRAAAWLSLAATPSFALMALLTADRSGSAAHLLCGATDSPLSGMVPMYVLMSVFHAAPWLRLLDNNRRPGG